MGEQSRWIREQQKGAESLLETEAFSLSTCLAHVPTQTSRQVMQPDALGSQQLWRSTPPPCENTHARTVFSSVITLYIALLMAA